MKTKNLFAVILLMFAVGFASCKKENNSFSSECGKFYLTETEFVSFRIVPNVVSANSTNIEKFENHTQKLLRFYPSFTIVEYFNGKSWQEILVDALVSWDFVINYIVPSETFERNIDLHWWVRYFNDSKKGKYRVVRRFQLQSNTTPCLRTDVAFRLYTEFYVE